VPEGSDSVDVHGATVIPEFEVLAMLVLAASIVGVIAYARVSKSNILSGMKSRPGQS
jgi:predicted secreted protein with PEFG-CTERM motif